MGASLFVIVAVITSVVSRSVTMVVVLLRLMVVMVVRLLMMGLLVVVVMVALSVISVELLTSSSIWLLFAVISMQTMVMTTARNIRPQSTEGTSVSLTRDTQTRTC